MLLFSATWNINSPKRQRIRIDNSNESLLFTKNKITGIVVEVKICLNSPMSQIAVVTGAGKGLGKAFAIALAKWGYTVVVHYNLSREEAGDVLAEIKQKSPKSVSIKADLTHENEVGIMFEAIAKKFGRIDLLINNVGNFAYREFSKTTNAQFRDIIESNLYSALYCSREALVLMRKQKSGAIINIGCVGAERVTITQKSTPYFIAKTSLYMLTKIMANEEAGGGIRVNMISPASLETDIFKEGDFPMGRSANYDDVIKMLRFLISDDAYYINGANIEVAGAFIPGIVQGK